MIGMKWNLCYVALLLVGKVFAKYGGLGDEFQPSVKATCLGFTMTVRVDTTEPFFGLVNTLASEGDDCSEIGRGGLTTFLSIDLSQPKRCGVTYDKESDVRSVTVSVRAHPSLALLEDRVFILTCGKASFQSGSSKVFLVQLAVTDGYKKLEAVLEDSGYALKATVTDPDPEKGLLVKNCRAFDGLGSSVQLVDDRACRAEKYISEFSYRDSVGIAEATIFSMFKTAESNRTYFQCDVEICSGPCPKPVCGGLYTGTDAAGLQSVSEDTVTASTSVYVADPGSEAAVTFASCSDDEGGSINPAWISGIAIAFGVLFALMLCINVFLCSAMTCSCTRTEVIEQEPSIYDDYSYNGSHYGSGKDGPYSESDLGSEYGDMTGTLRQGSEAGTITSRYSHGRKTTSPTQ